MNGAFIKEMGEVIYYVMGLHPQSTMISPASFSISNHVGLVNRVTMHNWLNRHKNIDNNNNPTEEEIVWL